jgi:hypothetical protein
VELDRDSGLDPGEAGATLLANPRDKTRGHRQARHNQGDGCNDSIKDGVAIELLASTFGIKGDDAQ